MRKVTVVGYRPVRDAVVESLQSVGAVDIVAQDLGLESDAPGPEDAGRRRLEELSADAHFVVDFLKRYHVVDAPFSSFISEKVHVAPEAFARMEADTTLLQLHERCTELSDRMAGLQRERARLLGLVKDLEPWADVRLQIGRWHGTEHVALLAGTVPANEGPAIRQLLREVSPDITVQEYGGVGSRAAWIVLAHRSVFQEARAQLATTGFTEVAFPGLEDYPAEEAARARDRLDEIASESAELDRVATDLASRQYAGAVTVAEAVDSDLHALDVRSRFGRTERTFVLRGWVRETRVADLEGALAPFEDALDLELAEPGPEDEPPVELVNPWYVRPFEVLTDLYGRPQYRELDPTPFLAPFFLLFFGLCIGDVGYGAALIVGAWLIKTRLDVAPGVKRFMDLLMFGGVSAMVIGVLTGSYFAIDVAALPGFLKALMIINPMEQLTTFLGAMVVLGVVQVFFGVLIAAYDAARRGDVSSAVNDQLSTIMLAVLIGVAVAVPGAATWALVFGLGVAMLMKGHAIEAALGEGDLPSWERAAGVAWVVLACGWMAALAFRWGSTPVGWTLLAYTVVALFASKAVRRTVVALLGGAYAVYGMSAFIGDILSYTRLAALGLSGTLVGGVFNLLAGLVWKPVGALWASGPLGMLGAVVVAVLAAAIFAGGHTFNVVINLLGAFVHPARLQFVEFFSKFYEGGGRAFDPFRYKTKSVVLDAGVARQEGARS